MKTANKIATTVAAFMMAATAQAGDYTGSPSFESQTKNDDNKLTHSFTLYGCTKDNHLVTKSAGAAEHIIETPENPLTQEELEALRDAYYNLNEIDNRIFAFTIAQFTAEELEQMNYDVTDILSFPLNFDGDSNTRHAIIENIKAQIPDMLTSLQSLKDAADDISSNLGGQKGVERLPKKIEMGRTPSPLCK